MTIQEAYELAVRHHRVGQLEQALALYRQILAADPNHAETWSNLGTVLKKKGELGEAIEAFRRAVALRPSYAEAYNNLGNALKSAGQTEEAIAAYRQALALRPQFPQAWFNLGNVLKDAGRLDDAISAYRQALALQANFPAAHANLGNAMKDRADLDEAIACYRKSLELNPDARVASNLLYGMHFQQEDDAGRLYEQHARWNRTYAESVPRQILPQRQDPDPHRRLRIGYVSPDFNEHPVGRFMLPLLSHHDHASFEIFCYADVRKADALTERLATHADVWHDTTALSDEQLAQLVADDRIDVLVDLALHTNGNRLLMFARKPAPVQVTYLAYCSTTGVGTIDYRLTDPYFDPASSGDEFYSEKSIHLPRTWWCYQPPDSAPDVSPLPARASGNITFGCLNNFAKVTPATLSMWAQLLREAPGSSLLLHSHEGSHRQKAQERLARDGVDPNRLQFVGRLSFAKYLEQYARIDIALDPFPFGGGTTTCDALWMGAPVISLAGRTAVSRAGLSILSNIGLPDLVAHTPDDYVRIAATLASNRPELEDLRTTLRDRMRSSPLMDAPQFARDVETAYRQISSARTETSARGELRE